jgi:glycosyltransferase involved in cell wall biosynthesis
MKRLIVIAQIVDSHDDHRGPFIDWLREFGKHFDDVRVISLQVGAYDLPPHIKVYSLGKESGTSKFIQAMRIYWYLFRFLPGSSGIFTYASPVFVIAAWPMAFIFQKKIIFWYLHRAVTLKLKLALALCFRLVTASADALQIQHKKIVSLGHGIDIGRFQDITPKRKLHIPLRLISIGRISAIKRHETLIKAAALLKQKGIDLRLIFVGKTIVADDERYLRSIKDLLEELGISEWADFVGSVGYHEIPANLEGADILVNCCPTGGLDKVVLEAMAAARPVLVCNAAFRKDLISLAAELMFPEDNPEALADKIISLINLPEEMIEQISSTLRQRVIAEHSLNRTIANISALI